MRGALMTLGVVLHSAQVYNPSRSWIVFNDASFWLTGFLVDAIHLFRMPAFFIVSGFFAGLLFQRYGSHQFLKTRLQRIGIPFLVIVLTLNPAQAVLLNLSAWRDYDVGSYLQSSESISHLWFLVNLIVYYVAIAGFAALANSSVFSLLKLAVSTLSRLPISILLILLPLTNLAILAAGSAGLPIYGKILGVVDIFDLLRYFPYFLIGLALNADRELLQRFCRQNPLITALMILLPLLAEAVYAPAPGLLNTVAFAYLDALMVWASANLCFYVFYTFFNKKSALARALSEASYSIYLLHHFLVVAVGIAFIAADVPPSLGFAGIALITASLTLLAHRYVVSRFRPVRFLLNGR
jgi:glucan biosynthesis protein C